MSGNQISDNDRALAGEYALGLLPPEAARAFERRLANEPDLCAVYAEYCDGLSEMTRDLPIAKPNPSVLKNIEAELFAGPDNASPWWQGIGGILAGGLVATLLGLLAVMLLFPPDQPSGPGDAVYVAELSAADGPLRASARVDPVLGVVTLELAGAAAPEGRDYELWVISEDTGPVSLGVIAREAAGRHIIPPALLTNLDGATLAISEEPAGGSQTGAPTGPVLASAALTKA